MRGKRFGLTALSNLLAARLLGKYVHDKNRVPLVEAVRQLWALSASNLKLVDRGRLKAGYYADIAVFDPSKIAHKATFVIPQQYAAGMRYVLVNGVPVLRDGEPTGATPGRFVKGPGHRRCH